MPFWRQFKSAHIVCTPYWGVGLGLYYRFTGMRDTHTVHICLPFAQLSINWQRPLAALNYRITRDHYQ